MAPNFLLGPMGSTNFMRLSLKKGAHAAVSRAACRKFGVFAVGVAGALHGLNKMGRSPFRCCLSVQRNQRTRGPSTSDYTPTRSTTSLLKSIVCNSSAALVATTESALLNSAFRNDRRSSLIARSVSSIAEIVSRLNPEAKDAV